VTDVTIHHSEQEWESYASQDSRVRFQVARNTVSIDQVLEYISEIISPEVGWRSDLMFLFVFLNQNTELAQLLINLSVLIQGTPEGSMVKTVYDLHLIEGLEHGLLSGKEHLVDIEGRLVILNSLSSILLHQIISQASFALFDGISSIPNALLNLANFFLNLHPVLRHIKSLSVERVTDLLDPLSELTGFPEHNDVSASVFFGTIGSFILKVLILKQTLTFCGPENQSLKALKL